MSSLTDARCVVTGATSGIGAALTHRLLAAGARVIGLGRRADALAELTRRGEGRFTGVRCDLADPADRARALAALADAARVDLLVNSAGEATYAAPGELGAAGWRALYELNLHAVLELTLGLADRLAPGGQVVQVSSVTARCPPSARFAAYAATKAALDRATEALRLELDPRGVRVCAIAPGLVETPLYDKVAGFADARGRLARQVPRWLSADDVADAIVWMATRPAHVVVAELVVLPLGQGR